MHGYVIIFMVIIEHHSYSKKNLGVYVWLGNTLHPRVSAVRICCVLRNFSSEDGCAHLMKKEIKFQTS
jgi:hypothetical protein